MSHFDTGLAITGGTVVLILLIGLAHWFIKHDYQLTASFRISRRTPPQPKAPRAAEQVAPVTDITRQAS